MTQEQVLRLVSHNLKYGAYVYNQLTTLYDSWDGNYKIEYLYDKIPDNSLLFMVPVYSSKETNNKLTLRYLTGTRTNSDGTQVGVYAETTLDIFIENPEGFLTRATSGDILPNRLCIFRFIKGDNKMVILINSPLYNSISVSTLNVVNETTFHTIPTVVDKVTESKIPLVTKVQLAELENRISILEDRIRFGTTDANEALADAEEGTIYIQVENGD